MAQQQNKWYPEWVEREGYNMNLKKIGKEDIYFLNTIFFYLFVLGNGTAGSALRGGVVA